MSEDRRERALKLALAGLLHDIGKVALRAGDTGASRTWDAEAKQDYGRLHALLSHDVVATLVPPTLGGEEIRHWAGQHHRPSQREHYIVRLADRLSSGERTETEKEDEPATQPKQLLSIFSVIQADGEDNPHSLYWPLRPLDLNDGATAEQWFPAAEWDSKRVAQAYGKLWGDFKDQALTLKQAHSNGGGFRNLSGNFALAHAALFLECSLGVLPQSAGYQPVRPQSYDGSAGCGAGGDGSFG